MGGQACVFYGAAEFSRDTDLALLADGDSLQRFREALTALDAAPVAVPPFELDYLLRGHAVHFRCAHPEAAGMRIGVMTTMRGVAPFEALWERRTTLDSGDGSLVELMGLADLVQAKKTQRDKAAQCHRQAAEADVERRPLLASAVRGDLDGLAAGLDEEQRGEQAADRAYWATLRRELEILRRARRAAAADDAWSVGTRSA